jgi:Alternative complex III, ActD subunit
MSVADERPRLYGLMAEFATPDGLIAAAARSREAGYRRVEAYTPYPIEAVSEALHLKRSHLPLIVLIGGILGALGGYFLQYWVNVYAYPLNIGGRPIHSWPAFIVPTFETTILCAALSAVLGMFALNGLPQPYHPVFNVPRFAAASRDSFFLVIEATDPRFDRRRTEDFLRDLDPSEVTEVEA